MDENVYVILMAGGSGTRFWPHSRQSKPKQFLDILGMGKSLLQASYDRYTPICKPENIYIVTSAKYRALVIQQLPSLSPHQILSEPMSCNTAPCIAYAAHFIAKKNPEAIMIVSPADHVITQERAFHKTLQHVVSHASKKQVLITLGIKPHRVETGYGYIQYLEDRSGLKKVKTFTEKPAYKLASKFVKSGDFVWNSGIFVWQVQVILQAFATYLPDMAESFADTVPYLHTPNEKQAIETAYSQIQPVSIDYGILEKANNVYVWQGKFAWTDMGSWHSLWDNSPKDENNNSIQAKALVYNTKNSIIRTEQNKLLIVHNLDGYLVAAFHDVVIVCKKDEEKLFRQIIHELKNTPEGEHYL